MEEGFDHGNYLSEEQIAAINDNTGMPLGVPFGENPFTEEETSDIGQRLNTKLTKEQISYRVGQGGSKLAYLETFRAVEIANDIFGFNGWCSSVSNFSIDFVEEVNGKVSCGVSVQVKIQLKDGSYHEDIGYGISENFKSKGQALEKAKKEAVSDGIKRAFRLFGNALGNSIYDKEHVKSTQKVPTVNPVAPPTNQPMQPPNIQQNQTIPNPQSQIVHTNPNQSLLSNQVIHTSPSNQAAPKPPYQTNQISNPNAYGGVVGPTNTAATSSPPVRSSPPSLNQQPPNLNQQPYSTPNIQPYQQSTIQYSSSSGYYQGNQGYNQNQGANTNQPQNPNQGQNQYQQNSFNQRNNTY